MNPAWTDIPGDPATGILLIGDHASNHVPADVDLGVPAALMREHVAIDIGVAPLAQTFCTALGFPAILGGVSRLVADFNREEEAPGLVPISTDGHVIPGNIAREPAERIDRFWRPYHDHIAERIAADAPRLLISLHSFTPRLASDPQQRRPWEIGILYNRDERAARIAIPLLEAAGIVTGDNQPYSGRVLNATMNLHGEANGIAYLGLEVRQDLIGDDRGVALWAQRLIPVIVQVAAGL
jgi:predicted N-formylglutamate amidohydrolase